MDQARLDKFEFVYPLFYTHGSIMMHPTQSPSVSGSLSTSNQCMARIWKWDANGVPLQCQKKKKEGFGDFCGQHGKRKSPHCKPCISSDLCGWNQKPHEFVWECCGRVDEPVPKQYRKYWRTRRVPSNNVITPRLIETQADPLQDQTKSGTSASELAVVLAIVVAAGIAMRMPIAEQEECD